MKRISKPIIYAFLVYLILHVIAYSLEQYHYDILFVKVYPLASFAQSVRLIGVTLALAVFVITLVRQKQTTTKVRRLK